MEYGEEDDDPDEAGEESCKNNSSVAVAPKPFWAVWIVACFNWLILWMNGNASFGAVKIVFWLEADEAPVQCDSAWWLKDFGSR